MSDLGRALVDAAKAAEAAQRVQQSVADGLSDKIKELVDVAKPSLEAVRFVVGAAAWWVGAAKTLDRNLLELCSDRIVKLSSVIAAGVRSCFHYVVHMLAASFEVAGLPLAYSPR